MEGEWGHWGQLEAQGELVEGLAADGLNLGIWTSPG